jgi:hypothetical protein
MEPELAPTWVYIDESSGSGGNFGVLQHGNDHVVEALAVNMGTLRFWWSVGYSRSISRFLKLPFGLLRCGPYVGCSLERAYLQLYLSSPLL